MMWQDFVFMLGSSLSIVFLAPTLRDASSRVPLGTSFPSMAIGMAYGFTFSTLGMTFSAMGAVASGAMWALIALFRSPRGRAVIDPRVESASLFVRDARRFAAGLRSGGPAIEEFVGDDADAWTDPATAHEHGHAAD